MPYVSLTITPPQLNPTTTGKQSQIYVGFSTVDSATTDSRIYDTALIKQNILNQFNTAKGERLMDPAFGTVIWEALYEPFDDAIKTKISDDVTRIASNDPRAVPIEINIIEQPYGMLLELTLAYQTTNQTELIKLNFDKASGLITQ